MQGRVTLGEVVPLGQTPSGTWAALACTAPSQASGVLTSNNTNVSPNDTVTIGGTVYTFVTALSVNFTAGQVLIGSSADASLTNLISAVNNNVAGTAGVKFYGREANPQVIASSSVTVHAVTFTALSIDQTIGPIGNTIPTTTTASTLSWSAATLTGGAAGTLLISTAAGAGALNVSIAQPSSGKILSDIAAYTGTWEAITILSDAVFTLLTGSVTGYASITIPAGVTLFGSFTAITLASGSVVAYTP